jgi:DNA-binding CsgD family transcriptional regulator
MDADERLSAVIGEVYDASLDPALWSHVLETVCGYIGCSGAAFHSQDLLSHTANLQLYWGNDKYFADAYQDKYCKINPIFPGILFSGVNEIHIIPDYLPCEEFVRTRFFREWLRPQGYVDGLFSSLEKQSTSCVVFTLLQHKFHGSIDEDTRRRAQLLTPHLRRAILIGKVIDLRKVEAAALADTLDGLASGIFLVDETGRLIHTNASGHTLLAEGNVLRAPNGRLGAVDAKSQQSLLGIFTAAAAGDVALGQSGVAVPLKGRDQENYVAHVLPLTSGRRRQAGTSYAAAAALFVHKGGLDHRSPFENMVKLYGLTPAEMRVAFGIVNVGGTPAVAETFGIAETTVKTHLKSIFQKTGASRQADLVKLVAALASPLAAD